MALAPLPVSRFNYEQALLEADARGREIAAAALAGPRPFASAAEQWRWEAALPYVDWRLLEEKLYLAGLVVENAPPAPETAREDWESACHALDAARRLAAAAGLVAATDEIEAAYERGRAVWRAAGAA